jgi:hypothetical protein
VKAAGVIGSFNISVSFLRETIREITYDGLSSLAPAVVLVPEYRRAYIGADFAGAVWNFGMYGEAALGLPGSVADGTGPVDFNLERDFEFAVGFDSTIPVISVDTRAEYYYRGEGAKQKSDYDPLLLMSGASPVLGRHYLFLYASRLIANYFMVTCASLTNLTDNSWMLLPEITWDAASNLEVKLGAYIPIGAEGSEFDGRYDMSPLLPGTVDLVKPQIYTSVKLSF